jgi:hypothetical protein
MTHFIFNGMVEETGLRGATFPVSGAGGPRFKSGRPDHISSVQNAITNSLIVLAVRFENP